MLAPDLTYSFRMPKDVSGPTFEILSRDASISDTSTTVTFTLDDLPKDRLLILSNIQVHANPGAAQGMDNIRAFGTTPAGQMFGIARLNEPVVAGLTRSLNWQGQVYIMGGGRGTNQVTIVGGFDSGVAANVITVGIHGLVIPRANAAAF